MNPVHDKPVLLVALGGNALIKKGQEGTIAEQFENLRVPIEQIARLSLEYRIIITHGNGPQVGNLLLQQECCDAVPKLPLEILVAQTEGQIGYMIESTLDKALMALGVDERPLVSLITYVVVDKNDPAFKTPTKPIGPAFSREKARTLPYPTVETAKGFRRVAASPKPVTIVERREIQRLIDMDFIVICCGGGGIPVIREGRAFSGVDAVIDKDLASVRLALEVGVDIFMIATDVDGAVIHFGTDKARLLNRLTTAEAGHYLAQGHFPEGSMGPKVAAAAAFIQAGGRRAVITAVNRIEAAVTDLSVGTQVTA
ncbi:MULTISPECIES: carbamate kinase [Desulfococcus]|jgi:carbamate kinase|uniref:Carbamate kinase n=1 Tax=Desulfococcus multivorans DSM 2059 TaxID=1121405 RepID=S7TQF6_DESML|nr:carbamate kinase [Desulfococcus multivorans]AOY60280.1 CpkA: carbamate kinase [Desulfococcus multivorans]AQV02391.1 carbamate kinase [Desulfococcus multivorans]EPR39206.1 aspartate/glutamate/uridylate kinase [Desulfococcus multivorans DSM 2059]MDX9819701.1 carbamate kinase [Desulfococcus multivorans]SJZ57811.1 carbamate kinase [Desulfococcus multivorans DSM 2059]